MKKLLIRTNCIRYAIFIMVAISLFSIPKSYAQEYTTKMESIFTDPESNSTHMAHVKSAIDSKNNLHIVFLAFNNHTYYGTNQSGAWKFEKLKYYDNYYKENIDVIKLPNILVDEKDNVHIVTFDQYGEKLVYGKKPLNTGEFNLKTIDISPKPHYLSAFSAMSGENADLAMDKNGGLHLICKADYRAQPDFKYSQSAIYFNKPANSETWLIDVLVYDKQWSERNWAYGTNPSIVCYNDKVYVSFGGSNELHFCTRNITGGKWDIERLILTPDEFINSGKWMTSLAVSPNGSLKFAFYEGTEDENSPWHGISIFSRSACGKKEWKGIEFPDNPGAKGAPAVAFDNNGKFYLAMARNTFSLWHQTCDCSVEYKKIYENVNNKGDFSDMIIDKQNTVYTFFTSTSDNKLYLLTAKPNSSTEKCNYPPKIVNYTGKTNLKPGEEWTGTIKAWDPECDNIKFESIIHNEIFTLKDNGDGTATITATMPEGSGKGTPGLSIWALDDKHPNTNNETSVITFKLVVTPEGEEKGSIKVENKCIGKDASISISSKNFDNVKGNQSEKSSGSTNTTKKTVSSNSGSTSSNSDNGTKAKEDKTEESNSSLDPAVSKTCNEYLDEYEAWADKYIAIKKKVNANPMDMNAVMKLAQMAPEIASWTEKWATLYECGYDEGFQARYEKISDKIDEVN